MKRINIVAIAFAIFSMLMLSACKEGPAEKHGKKIDNTIEKIKDKIQDEGPAEKAGSKLDDAVETIKDKIQDEGPAEKAGKKLDDVIG